MITRYLADLARQVQSRPFSTLRVDSAKSNRGSLERNVGEPYATTRPDRDIFAFAPVRMYALGVEVYRASNFNVYQGFPTS